MAQSGYTPISLYYSTTAAASPTAGNLTNGELAINITDGKLFYKDNGGVVRTLASKATGTIGGSTNQVQYNSSGSLAGSANLTYDGTTFATTGAANFATSSGNVGIGTASPAQKLDVRGVSQVSDGTVNIQEFVASTTGYFGTTSNHPLNIRTNNLDRVTIDSSGNVGVSSGNLTFSGTGQRITGDFTSSPIANRVIFQTSTANSTTGVNFIPSGTGTRSVLGVFGGSDTANSAICTFEITTSQSAGLNSTKVGTGVTLPLVFSIDSAVQLQLNTNGTISSADNAAAVGYKGTPINEQSAAYTLVLSDQGKSIVHPITDNNARTFTIPANGTVAFPVGTTITFINMINTVTISITTDTMYLAGSGSTGSRTLAAYGVATAVKLTSTTWIISGDGLT